jgi:hypothetical protein
MALWKKILLRSAGFGGGFAVVFALIVWLSLWWSNRPKEWTASAITAKPTELSFNEQGEELHFRFRYALTNNTKADYLVASPGGDALMKKLPEDGSLMKLDGATWDNDVRVPPKQTINVVFDVPIKLADYSTSIAELNAGTTEPARPTKKYVDFVNRRLKEMNGLVLMDYRDRFRIDLPSNWQKAGQ